jgi:hypothetical protein
LAEKILKINALFLKINEKRRKNRHFGCFMAEMPVFGVFGVSEAVSGRVVSVLIHATAFRDLVPVRGRPDQLHARPAGQHATIGSADGIAPKMRTAGVAIFFQKNFR